MGFYGNATYYLPNGTAKYVADGVITESKLAENAVVESKIAPEAIHGSKGQKMNDNNEQSSHIAPKSIGTDDIADGAITAAQLGENAVTVGKIKKGSINSDKIGLNVISGGPEGSGHLKLNTITIDNMAEDSIGKDQIVGESITTEKIAFDTVTGGSKNRQGNIAPNTIQGYNIMLNTIQGAGKDNDLSKSHIGSATIGQNNMADNSINAAQIIADAVRTEHIQNESIHGNGDNDYFPDYKHIAPGSIGTEDISNDAITEDKMANKFWRYETFFYNDKSDMNFTSQLSAFLRDDARRYCNNYIFVFEISNKISEFDLSSGTYIGWKKTSSIQHYLHNVRTNEYWLYDGDRALRKIKITSDHINLNTITGGENGNIAPGTIQGWNIDEDTIEMKHLKKPYSPIFKIEETLKQDNFNNIIYPIFHSNQDSIVQAYFAPGNGSMIGETIIFLIKTKLYIVELGSSQLWRLNFSENMSIPNAQKINNIERFSSATSYTVSTNTFIIELNDSHIFDLENSYSSTGNNISPIIYLNAYNNKFNNSCKIYFLNSTTNPIIIRADTQIFYNIIGQNADFQIGANNNKELQISLGSQGQFCIECSKINSGVICNISKLIEAEI